MYGINNLPAVILIGRQTETGVEEIAFDCSGWLEKWPGMQISILAIRPGEADAYPAAIRKEGAVVVWEVNASDTAIAGDGYAELIGLVDGKRKLSRTINTRIVSIKSNVVSEVPEAAKSWVDQVLEAAKRAEDAAERAEGAGSGGGGSGEDGGYYTPSVSNEGELTWKASKNDMPQAPSANIRGPKGAAGSSGVYIGDDEPTDPNVNVWIKPDGEIAQEETWELIETIAGAGAVITRTKEPNGTPYKFKAMIARVNNNGVSVSTSLYAKSNGTFIGAGYHTSTDARKMFAIEVRQDHGWWISDNYLPNSSAVQYAGTSRASESFMFKHTVEEYPYIDTFTTSAVIPAGVVVEIWGLRA